MIIDEAASWAVETWRQYPAFAAQELLNMELIAPQRIVLNRFWHGRFGICLACRGFGKTIGAATMACLSASFRQAKQIFDEIKHIWQISPLLRQSTIQRPIISNDACRLEFKAAPGMKTSVGLS